MSFTHRVCADLLNLDWLSRCWEEPNNHCCSRTVLCGEGLQDEDRGQTTSVSKRLFMKSLGSNLRHTHTLSFILNLMSLNVTHIEYQIFRFDKLRNIILRLHKLMPTDSQTHSWSLTIPVVADGYPLTYCSVAEVEEVGLHKLWEEVLQVVRVWEKTRNKEQDEEQTWEETSLGHVKSAITDLRLHPATTS